MDPSKDDNTAAVLKQPLIKEDEKNKKKNENSDDTTLLYSETYHPFFLPLLVLVFPIMLFFWTYHVTVTKDKTLSFGYSSSWTMRTVDNGSDDNKEYIESAEPVEHINGLTSWGGWGIRLNLFSGETGYISKNGPGVRIVLGSNKDSKKSTYVFNCQEPQKVCDLLLLLNHRNKEENDDDKDEHDDKQPHQATTH